MNAGVKIKININYTRKEKRNNACEVCLGGEGKRKIWGFCVCKQYRNTVKWKSQKECLLNVSKDHEYVCVSCVWMNSMTRMYVNIINMCFNSVYKIHGHIEKGEGEKTHTCTLPLFPIKTILIYQNWIHLCPHVNYSGA